MLCFTNLDFFQFIRETCLDQISYSKYYWKKMNHHGFLFVVVVVSPTNRSPVVVNYITYVNEQHNDGTLIPRRCWLLLA